MKRKRILILFAALLIIAFLLWHFRPRPQNQRASSPTIPTSEAQIRNTLPIKKPHLQSTTNQSPLEEARLRINERIKEMEIANERANDEWRTPIEFYGKVVDENNIAIEGAQINFSCNDLSSAGTSYYNGVSDPSGLFSIGQIKGKLLVVGVSKEGYYTSKREADSFYYAGQNVNFVANPDNPIVFHLRKKGNADPLVVFENDFLISKDGKAVDVSLTKGKPAPLGQGDLRVECWTDDQGKKRGEKYDWKCRITVPNGGLVLQSTNEFNFEAPLEGYQPFDEIKMPTTLENGWQRNAEQKYFLKLGNGNYARIKFKMIAGGGHFFHIESFLNPAGARNLEYDEAVQPKQTVFE